MNTWKWTRRFFRCWRGVEEEVHQHRLAADHRAPEIDPARRLGPPEQGKSEGGLALARQLGLQPRQRRRRGVLRRIRPERPRSQALR